MNIKIYDSSELLYNDVASFYKEKLNKDPKLVLGLATGTTPIPLYKRLIKANHKGEITFKNVTSYNLDEYVGLPKGHEASYYFFMRDNLFNHVDINLDKTFIPDGSIDAETAIKNYQELLDKAHIDIQLLGLGSNGHIGFNEPGTSFHSHTHKVTLAEKTRKDNARLFSSIDEVPHEAVTMGIADIMRAKEIVLIATGKNKAEAVYGMIKGEVSESLPASILQKHPNVHVYLDQDAASLLLK